MAFRLLVVTSDTFPPTRVDVSVLFGKHLAARGHRIDWILQSEAACEKAYVEAWGGGRAWVGPTNLGTSVLSRISKHTSSILHDLRLLRLMARGGYDIIEVKDKFVSGVFAVVAARIFRKRFVYWLSYPFPESYLYRAGEVHGVYRLLYRIRGAAFKVLLYRLLLPAADHVFVQSEQMRQNVAAEGVPLEKMTAVPMGVEMDSLPAPTTTEPRRTIPEGERSFVYLGALGKVRRLDILVRALAIVRERLPDVKLYVVGRGDDPSDEQLLTAEASRLGLLDALVLVGQLPRPEALAFVRDADVCVSPIFPTPVLNAASPTKLVEYMAMGKPVVANDHPEQRLVISESGAGYCVPWDEEAFASAIVRLLVEPDEARRMGERGRRYVAERRSYDVIADIVERAFLDLVEPRFGDQHERS